MERGFYNTFVGNKLKLFLFIACSIIFLSSIVNAEEPVEEWVSRYDGTANGYDNASDIVTDSSGNVYPKLSGFYKNKQKSIRLTQNLTYRSDYFHF